jgi:hypothetical protein
VPERRPLAVDYRNGVASFTVPRVLGHQAICVEA